MRRPCCCWLVISCGRLGLLQTPSRWSADPAQTGLAHAAVQWGAQKREPFRRGPLHRQGVFLDRPVSELLKQVRRGGRWAGVQIRALMSRTNVCTKSSSHTPPVAPRCFWWPTALVRPACCKTTRRPLRLPPPCIARHSQSPLHHLVWGVFPACVAAVGRGTAAVWHQIANQRDSGQVRRAQS